MSEKWKEYVSCTCTVGYTGRGLTDPSCMYCNTVDLFEMATAKLKQRCEELEEAISQLVSCAKCNDCSGHEDEGEDFPCIMTNHLSAIRAVKGCSEAEVPGIRMEGE